MRAAARELRGRARAVRGRQGRRLRPRRRAGARAPRWPAARAGWRSPPPARRRAARGGHRRRRCSCMGALDAERARRRAGGRRRRRRLARARSSRAVAARGGGARARQARHGMGRLGHARRRRGARAVADAVAAAPRARARRRDDALRHRRRARRRRSSREQLARFARWAEPLRARAPRARRCTPPTARRRCATRARTSTWCAAAIAIYGLDPFSEDPAAHGLEPALELRSYVADGQAVRAGGERRLRAALRRRAPTRARDACRSATATACGAALTNNADVLVGGRRYPLVGTVSMDNVTVDARRREPASRRGDEAVLIGAQGGERITAEERRAAARTRSTTRSPAA